MIASLFLFFSGAAALVYQTLWVKQLALVVGVDVYAVTTVVSAFFAGLALGGLVFGRWADRVVRPLMLYSGIEVLIAVLGLAASIALAQVAPLFVALQEAAGPLAWFLPFLLIGIPAFLMGGTLPVLLRVRAPDTTHVGRASGMLYAANTAGAIAGTLSTPFWLVPALGVRGTALAAVGCNLALAGAAFIYNRSRRPVDKAPAHGAANESPPSLTRDGRAALFLYAVAGGVALGYEVVWTQAIVPFLSTRIYAFAIVLATYLLGLALGSFLYARWADRIKRPWMSFGVLIAGAGVSALVLFALLGAWLPELQDVVGKSVFRIVPSNMAANCARFALAASVLVLVPTLLLGAAFPAAMRLIAKARHVGRHAGTVTALNTAGGIAGTVLTGFVFVPLLGLVRTLGVLAIGAALLGGLAWLHGSRRRVPSALAVLLVVASVASTAMLVPQDKLARLLAATKGGTVEFYEESPGGTVAVLSQQASHTTFKRLYIQGTSNSGDALTSIRYMRLQTLLPLLIHNGEPRSALVVGLGTGITCGALLAYPGLERRVCAELLPAVVRAAPRFKGNFNAVTDPRITLRIMDGRRELLRSEERYDLITLEPPPPSAAGVVNLYSRDFYELCRVRLNPKGLMAQWWPLHTQNDEDSRCLVQSVLEVFPHVTLWTTELHEMLLMGSMEPMKLDAGRITARFTQPEVTAALAEVGVASPAALLATYITDRAGLERYAGDAPAITDDRPRIEHANWMRKGEFSRVLTKILAERSNPPLQGDETLRSRVDGEGHRLMTFYRASLQALAGDKAAWGEGMRAVLQEDPLNPYYLWFIGKEP